MSRKILDSNKLINWWAKRFAETALVSGRDVDAWAQELIELYRTDLIVSPVYLEFLVHARSEELVGLYERFLGAFTVIDQWNVQKEDFLDALRLARRVPKDRKPRQLGDCLIRALANRFRCEVETGDRGFPR